MDSVHHTYHLESNPSIEGEGKGIEVTNVRRRYAGRTTLKLPCGDSSTRYSGNDG